MKHLVPDLNYCKKLKGVIENTIAYVDDDGFFYSPSIEAFNKPIISKVYPAPTTGELIKELLFQGYLINIEYCEITKKEIKQARFKYSGYNLLITTYGKNKKVIPVLIDKEKKLENSLAKALIELNKNK